MPATRILHPSAYPNAKKPFPAATRIDATGLAPGIKRLEEDGGSVLEAFALTFRFLAEQCGASTTQVLHQSDDGPHLRDATFVGPLKKTDRILVKCLNDYREVRPPYGAVCDVVRGTMAFQNPREMLWAVDQLVKWEAMPLPSSSATRFRLAQVKELYSKNFESLYGDVKLSMLFYVDEVPDGHVCELQLNTLGLIQAKGSPQGHVVYETQRTLENSWDREHPNVPCPRLEEIEEDWALYQKDPSDARLRRYGGRSAGMQDATVEDYRELYGPLIELSRKANAPARSAFDAHPDAGPLLARVAALSQQTATRWSERFEKNGPWSPLG